MMISPSLCALSALVSQRDSRYYSVDLDRGHSGFGFSLRGGSEYNMGLYVLGLMKGGPASRSLKMQVCLLTINGNSTAGMTHSQAVEQIRRGGHRIHLVLKRGNGYVPDYGETQWEDISGMLPPCVYRKNSNSPIFCLSTVHSSTQSPLLSSLVVKHTSQPVCWTSFL
uniref:PDZ domain-containing protein n=1 Tax=Sander lucioperca TaxID=283035 RepID=A0A8D0D5A9_SANLU